MDDDFVFLIIALCNNLFVKRQIDALVIVQASTAYLFVVESEKLIELAF
jgi:hypothetical protein